jgi:hypothetical protein
MRPYSYRVIEKSAGEVLLSQNNNAFTFGEEAYLVAEESNVVEDSSGIPGNLIFEGITVELGDLGGNLAVYCRKVRGVTKDGKTLGGGSDYHYDPQTQKLTVSFTGLARLLIKGADGLFD